MTPLSDLELLRRVPLFALLGDAQLRTLVCGVQRRSVARGEIIVAQEQRSDALFVLLTGQARVYIAGGGGREITLATLRPGDHLGEMSLVDAQPHSATVRAEAACELLVLEREQFTQCLPKSNSLAYMILRGLVQRLRAANRQITSLALLDVYGRVAGALLDMAEQVDGETLIRRRISREQLSKQIGASREMTGRVLKTLKRSGAIRVLPDGSTRLEASLPATAERHGRGPH